MDIDDITEADGSAPLEECKESRLRMVRTHMTPDGVAFRFYSDEYVHPHFPEIEGAAVAHIRACSHCRAWLDRVVPPDVLARAERMSHYCCSWMFQACEGEDERMPRLTFGLLRDDEPCWFIESKMAFARFCPWCGNPLPPHAFLAEE